jgi:uncharacterized membrane protein YqjE
VSLKTNMSAGELFELIMPFAYVVSALLSTWILASARKRFQLHLTFAFALATLFLPLVVFPLYLAIIIWRKKGEAPKRWRYLAPLLYAAIVLAAIGGYFYFDSRTVDAHLARATRARLVDDHNTAIREYRQALALEDNPHTHKLLALELANAGFKSQAEAEFRLAGEK